MDQPDDRFDAFEAVDHRFENAEARIERVERTELPSSVRALVNAYEKTVGVRDRFLWKWLYFIFPALTLSCVEATHEERVRDQKLVVTLFITVLDDLAERDMDRPTFEEVAKIPFTNQTPDPDRDGVDEECLTFAERVWDELESRRAAAPRASEFGSLFHFDVKQNINAIDYSYTVNQQLEIANVAETEMYDCNNMMLFTYLNLDVMHSPSFDRSELSVLRRIVLKGQKMARIGNWVTTWEREIREGDYSSGIVVYALENDIVDREELYKLSADRFAGGSDALIGRIEDRGIEEMFLDDWHRNYEEIRQLEAEVDSADVSSFASGLEKLLSYHLATRGLK